MAAKSPPAPTGTDDEDAPRRGADAVNAAANAEHLSQEEAVSATDWLLSDSAEDSMLDQDTVDLNVGTDEEPKWIRWTIRAITPDELKRAQRSAANDSRLKKGDVSDLDYHAKVLAIGTVDPDIKAVMKQVGATKQSDFLIQRFNAKSGLIPQLTARIMSMSGFDDAHVREVEAGKT